MDSSATDKVYCLELFVQFINDLPACQSPGVAFRLLDFPSLLIQWPHYDKPKTSSGKLQLYFLFVLILSNEIISALIFLFLETFIFVYPFVMYTYDCMFIFMHVRSTCPRPC